MNLRINHRKRRASRTRSAFTLLELLLVLAILVVIGGIVGGNMMGAQKQAYRDSTEVQMNNVKNSILRYQVTMNGLPETLEMLRDGPSDANQKKRWIEPIMKEIPTDAWNKPFVYTPSGSGFEIRSAGLDGQMNTDDDIVVTD